MKWNQWPGDSSSTDNLVQDTWDRGHFHKTSENQSGAYITVTQQDEDVTVLKGWPTRGPVSLLVVKCPFTGRGTGRFAHGSLREKCYSHTSRSAKGLTEVRLVRSTRTPARSRSGWDRGKGEESYVRWSRDRTYSFVDLLSDFVILSTQEATERSEPRHNMIYFTLQMWWGKATGLRTHRGTRNRSWDRLGGAWNTPGEKWWPH